MNYKWVAQNPVRGISGKKILIAGGTGFIGERVVTYLKNFGVQLYVLTRQLKPDSTNVKYFQNPLLHSVGKLLAKY
jgi:NAD dependent epimerase/dehydratase family enzyme